MDEKQQGIGDLHQRWVHSYEEDTETESVYRPASYAFPPARGRTGFELLADKSCKTVGIAAADGSTVTDGIWEFEDEDALRIRINSQDESQVLTVVSINRDRLVIRKDN